jgi:hypothetical protein
MEGEARRDVTLIQGRAREGDVQARDELISRIYDELRQVASRLMRRD